MAYARERNDMIIGLRYDICADRDMMATGIQQRLHQPVLDVNIYNPPVGSIGAHLTGQQLLNLPDTYPTGLGGDFNLHRPDREAMTTEPTIAAAKAMAEWLQDKSFRYSMYITTQRFTITLTYTIQCTVSRWRTLGRF